MKVQNLFLLLFSCFCLFSCHSSGTWEDDRENWERAFDLTLPDSIEMKHSWYWRSPHWSYECEYFFELEYSKNLEQEFLSADDLEQIDSSMYYEIEFFHDKPVWFVPKDYNDYEIWGSWQYENYYMFIDKKGGSIYFTQYQI